MSKFKIDDTIHHMNNNKPVENKITGIVKLQGEIKLSYTTFKSEENKELVIYRYGYESYISEEDVFKNENDLKNHLFTPLPKQSK